MLDWLSDPNAWLGLAALIILEIVLGIDNIIFLSLVVAKLPKHQQSFARKLGLSCAMIMRILLLFVLAWIAQISRPLFYIYQYKITAISPHVSLGSDGILPLFLIVSIRDIVLFLGGLFLIIKGMVEIKEMLDKPEQKILRAPKVTLSKTIVQIIILDIVFSLDSVITAVGLSNHLFIMITAVVIAVLLMMFAAKSIGDFVNNHPTVKMLTLIFLILVGIILIMDSVHYEVPKSYIYFALFFALVVEALNLWRSKVLGIHRQDRQ